ADVSVRLAQPPMALPPLVADREELQILAEPHASGASPLTGRVQIDVAVLVHGERRVSLAIFFDVKLLQSVAVCKLRVERGRAYSESNVAVERRAIDPNKFSPASVEAVLGRVAKRAVQPGQIVTTAD